LEIRDHIPKAFAMMKNMYLHPSRVWYFDMSDEPNGCTNGFHQGDVISILGYIVTIQPLLNCNKDKSLEPQTQKCHGKVLR
jgi:hypothetical protein